MANQKGSALVVALFAGTIAVLASFALIQLSTSYFKQNSDTAKLAAATGVDAVALDYLRGKFVFKKPIDGQTVIGPPEWYVDPYPTAGQIAQARQNNSEKIPGRVVAFAKASLHRGLVPKWLVTGVKDGVNCRTLPVPQPLTDENLPSDACSPSGSPILQFEIDQSDLGSVERSSGADAFVSMLNVPGLSDTIKSDFLNGTSVAPDSGNVLSSYVRFRKYNSTPQDPQALIGLEVQVGNTIADIPVELPPEPDCNIRLLSSQPNLGFEPGSTVNFALDANSITRTAKSPPEGNEIEVSSSQSVSTVGTFRQVGTFSRTIPQNPIGRQISDTMVGWSVQAKVMGARGAPGSNCSFEVNVRQIPPPNCQLSAADPKILKDRQTTLTLNCRAGGPVNSATIKGVSMTQQAPTANLPAPTKIFTLSYTRTEVKAAEEITAVVRGPLATVNVTTFLGAVCPFNDRNHYKALIDQGQWVNIKNIVSEEKPYVRNTIDNPDPVPFGNSEDRRVLSYENSPIDKEFLAQDTPFPAEGLSRDGLQTINSANCRWDLRFNPTNGNLVRTNAVLNLATLQLETVGTVLNDSGRTTFAIPLPRCENAIGRLTCNAEVSRRYDLKIDSSTGKLVSQETVVYQKKSRPRAGVAFQNDGAPVTRTQQFWSFGEQNNTNSPRRLILSGSGKVSLTSFQYEKSLAPGAPGCAEPPTERYYVGATQKIWNEDNIALGEIDRRADCKTGRICMGTYLYQRKSGAKPANWPAEYWLGAGWRDVQGTSYSYPLGVAHGQQGYWVEVEATDPQCETNIKRARARESGCFKSDTEILMADGTQRKISMISENDYVYNPHYQTGVKVKYLVKGPEKKPLFEVAIGQERVEVTEDHPFFTSRGWLQTLELKKGDILLGNGGGRVVNQVKRLHYKNPQEVWNFELDTDEPLGHVVVANGLPTGDLTTQIQLKNLRKKLP